MLTINHYLNNHHFNQWLNQQFDDPDDIINLLDTIADDGVYPNEFVDYCYMCLNFDQGKTIYPIVRSYDQPILEDDKELDYEFHPFEVPICDDTFYNNIYP